MQFDTLIINGKIVDGTGKSAYKADIGIVNQKISAIGSLKSSGAKQVINAENLIVSPGFIDMHTHSDISLINDPLGTSNLNEGDFLDSFIPKSIPPTLNTIEPK